MNVIQIITIILIHFGVIPKPTPVRLDKKEPQSKIKILWIRILPYLVLIGAMLVGALLMYLLIKYGASITGTEANHYYYGGLA